MTKYKFTVEGTSVEGNIWKTNGITFETEDASFEDTIELVLSNTFSELTKGNAVYSQPGKGCSGPYKITKLLIEKVK